MNTTTTEEWRDVPNFEGLYKVSNFGNVLSLKRNRLMQLVPDKYGSLLVTLYKGYTQKQYAVQTLVASVFINDFYSWSKVIHIDGNRQNNNVHNLKVENRFRKTDQDLKCDEEWRDIEGYEGLYQISNYGKVKSFKHRVHGSEGVILKPHIYTTKYSIYRLSDSNNDIKRITAHKLVAKAFIPNPKKYQEVNHKNGIKIDNRVDNLEWCTHQQNMVHAFTELYPNIRQGSRNSRATITDDDALQIYKLAMKNERSYADIGKEYGVSKSIVGNIKAGKTWSHVTKHKYVKQNAQNHTNAQENVV